jgi:hypothetical protein
LGDPLSFHESDGATVVYHVDGSPGYSVVVVDRDAFRALIAAPPPLEDTPWN